MLDQVRVTGIIQRCIRYSIHPGPMINFARSLITRQLIISSKCSKRHAGHSKWSNIKHDKAIIDAKRALNFHKLRRLMFVAIAEANNNADPSTNSRLAQIIETAKKAAMPAATINNVLKTATAAKTLTTHGRVDLRGPSGAVILVEYACDNAIQFKMSINTLLRKFGWSTTDPGVAHLFDYKGVITTEIQGDLGLATDHAIQVDAEDVQEVEHNDIKEYKFYCEPNVLFNVKQRLLDMNYKVKSAEALYIPRTLVNLSDSELSIAIGLCEKLEANEDVVRLHDNIA
ncbi:probable transcriptional regulatory protein PERMA_0079 [Diprion similis]|uniref:probable transcriptional regulatory protein PERMA_0079 n=1 Tax=Diprion similis TaxID=362088 RepID=UPI001EF9847B|nr:probable transcriptional regulatory protein PERMA_0079 [Diprion similis]